jgi:Outer membrane protein beta-barrel domain
MRALLLLLFFSPLLCAQYKYFVGAFGGISTLSADARTQQSGETTAFSTYKPANGPTFTLFGGRYLGDYLALMASYSWNRNDVTMNSGLFAGSQTFYEQGRRNTMHTVVGEGLLYFRPRASRVRPYLSAGFGATHSTDRSAGQPTTIGAPELPSEEFSHTGPCFRAAVGIDLFVHGGLAFRYSFSETIQGNPISAQLHPAGQRKLANFQNWFGVSYSF